MRTNKDQSIILIENPLTGNESFASAMGLSETLGMAKYARPTSARSAISREAWVAAKKVVLVRDPRERFESALTLAFLQAGSNSFTPEFNAVLEENLDSKAVDKAEAVLQFLRESIELAPEFFLPQSRWLTAKFDLVLATRDIAEYFNRVVGKCCLRKNNLRSNPQFKALRGRGDSPLVKVVYAEDYALFQKLKVWSLDPFAVRLVEGYCKRCMQNDVRFSGLIGGNQLSDQDEAPQPQQDEVIEEVQDDGVLHVRAKRKRQKPSTIDQELEVIDTSSAEE
jgi:hypothetical protein